VTVTDESQRNAFTAILRDLRDVLELASAVVGDDTAVEAVFGQPIDAGSLTALAFSAEALDQLATSGADLERYQEAAARVVEAAEAIRVAAQADLGADAGEFLGFVIDAIGLSYLARRAPWLLHTARLLRFIDDTEAVGPLLVAAVQSLIAFLGDPAGYLRERLGPLTTLTTEQDARRVSALLALVGLVAYIPELVKSERLRIDVLHGWETDPDTTTPLADALSERFLTIALGLKLPTGEEDEDEAGEHDDGAAVEAEIELLTTLAFVPRDHGGPGLWVSLGWGQEIAVALGGGWHLVTEVTADGAIDMFLPGRDAAHPARFGVGEATRGAFELRLERRDEAPPETDEDRGRVGTAAPWRLGPLEVKAATFTLRLSSEPPMLRFRVTLRDAALSVPNPGTGLLAAVLPADGLRIGFDVALVATNESGPRFEGGTGLEVLLPVSRRLGPVHAAHVLLALRVGEDGAPTFEVSAGLAVRIGAFGLTLDRIGAVLPEAPGRMRPPWFSPPSGIGISIDGDLVRGGGFLFHEPERGRYGGMLELTIGRYTLVAFGLYQELDVGYSLILVGSVRWSPPWPLLFGISLSGLGVLGGHNHGVDLAALQAGLRGGAAGTLLFPDDPVAAAPQILTTLSAVFPVTPGQSVLGLLAELSWSGGLVRMKAAVVLERGPQANRVVLLGRLEMLAPDRSAPILALRADFAGVIDPGRPAIEFDAALVDSWIGFLTLTGDVTLRFHGGDSGLFLLAAGGFHPGYTPPANANLPPQRRLALVAPSANPRLRLEQYWAVTSNTLQCGARLEVAASAGGFSAEALLSFDALVQLDPLRLQVDIEGRAAIRYQGRTLAGVRLLLHLEGPSPWHLTGKAELSLFLFSVTIPIETTFGADAPELPAPQADAAALLAAAFGDPSNWDTMPPTTGLVAVLRPPAGADGMAAHPLGRIAIRQPVLPLGIEITRVGRARVAADRFDVEVVTVGGVDQPGLTPLRAPFAAGQFVDLTDDERLSRPDFEPFVAGVAVTPSTPARGPVVAADLSYEEIVIGPDGPLEGAREPRPPLVRVVRAGAVFGAAGSSLNRRDEHVQRQRARPAVAVRPPGVRVVDAGTLATPPEVEPAGLGHLTVTEAVQAMAGLLAGHRAGARQLLVVGAHELTGGGG
jgi:hypothetical protein